jgi:hypothetical protein
MKEIYRTYLLIAVVNLLGIVAFIVALTLGLYIWSLV